jgi:hypothetical protein
MLETELPTKRKNIYYSVNLWGFQGNTQFAIRTLSIHVDPRLENGVC